MARLGRSFPVRTAIVVPAYYPAPADVTPPGNINVTSVTATKISRVAGKDATQITFTADEAFVEYQIRIVPQATSGRSEGTLIEQGTT